MPAEEVARYRIELVVVRHLDGVSEVTPSSDLRDFAEALDLLPPPAEEESGQEAERVASVSVPAPAASSSTAPGDLPGAAALPADEELLPPPVAHVALPGAEIEAAVDRIKRSRPFRAELFFAWEQFESEPFPLVRVHDGEVLELAMNAVPADESSSPADAGGLVFTDRHVAAGPDLLAAEAPLPRYYRIDGTARLSRSRFLHLDLDLEFRVPAAAVPVQAAVAGIPEEQPVAGATVPHPVQPAGPELPGFTIHRVRERRQVRSGEMQYFDGPVIGVLALITPVETLPDDASLPQPSVPDSSAELSDVRDSF